MYSIKKNNSTNLTENFSSVEFDCQCSFDSCKKTWIHRDLVTRLQDVRDEYGEPLVITSGYRCAQHQAELRSNPLLKTSRNKSTHEMGSAVDIRPVVVNEDSMSRLLEILERYFKSIGLAKNFYHVDMRFDKEKRRWNY